MSRMDSSRGNRTSNLIGRGKVPPVITGSVVAQRLAKRPIQPEVQGPTSTKKCNGGPCRPARITSLVDHRMRELADKAQRRRMGRSPQVTFFNRLDDFDDLLDRSLLTEIQANIAQGRIVGDNGVSTVSDS